jgi:hypothetical protein
VDYIQIGPFPLEPRTTVSQVRSGVTPTSLCRVGYMPRSRSYRVPPLRPIMPFLSAAIAAPTANCAYVNFGSQCVVIPFRARSPLPSDRGSWFWLLSAVTIAPKPKPRSEETSDKLGPEENRRATGCSLWGTERAGRSSTYSASYRFPLLNKAVGFGQRPRELHDRYRYVTYSTDVFAHWGNARYFYLCS